MSGPGGHRPAHVHDVEAVAAEFAVAVEAALMRDLHVEFVTR